QQVRRERETQTITSSVSPAAMTRVVRAHIRSPLVGLLWMFGLRQEDMMVGVILGDHLYARPVARDSDSGNTSRFLVLRGPGAMVAATCGSRSTRRGFPVSVAALVRL